MKKIVAILSVIALSFSACEDETCPLKPTLSDEEFTIPENSANQTDVGSVSVDEHSSPTIKYSIVGGDPLNAFIIDPTTGNIKVKDSGQLNFETTPQFILAVKALDTESSLDAVATVEINILNVIEIPSNGLVARYSFASGGASDLTGNGNNGVLSGITSNSDRFGIASESFNFNSNDDYIKVSNPSFVTNKQGTFVAWVKFTSLIEAQYIASVGDENSIESYISLIRFDPETKTLGIYQRESGTANWVVGTTVIEANKYYQVIMQSDGFGWSIYIDGKKEQLKIKSGINSGKWIGHLTGIDNFVIGSSIILPPYTIPHLSGNIDDVLMYNRVLSEKEIELLYNDTK